LPFDDPRQHLDDIRDSILLIEQFVHGMELNDYLRDLKTQAAVERKMLVISEAAIRLGDDAEHLYPGLPWRDIRGIGNWLRHAYDRIDAEIMWDTVRADLPRLKSAIDGILGPEAPSDSHR
jgi:uncharacterized protein with HEPN domain